MNILQILPELNVGGVETGTLDLTRHLVKLGHKAVVVSNGGDLVKNLESFGAIHYQLPVHEKSISTIIRMIPNLVKIIKKEEIDIIHARSRVPAWIAYFASRKTGRVFITTCHGYYKKHFFSSVMGWAKRVIVLSNVIGRHMVDDFSVPHERIRLIPRSVDLERFKYTRPDNKRGKVFNVGIIGRITPIKGHLHFIKAMAEVARVIPQLKIWIVGDVPPSKEAYKEQLQVLVRRLGLWHSTQFLGTNRDIPAILAHLDVLVLSTVTHEAFGRVIIEAQACGVPVVATRVGGVIDIIEEGKTGLFVPPSEPKSIAQGIIKLFKDKGLAVNLAENAYKKVKEKYNLELMVKNTLGVYKEALENFNILIIKFSSLGDVILSTPAIRAIRKKFPNNYPECSDSSQSCVGMPKQNYASGSTRYKISFLTNQESKEALLSCPYIDELLVCDFKNKDRGIKGLLHWADILRKKNFDIVVDLQNNRKSHLLSALCLSLKRYGYNKKLGFLLNNCTKDEGSFIDPISHQFKILKMLGIDLSRPFGLNSLEKNKPKGRDLPRTNVENFNLELWPTAQDQDYIDEFLNSEWLSANQKLVGINISASLRWLTKNWPLRHILKLCEELHASDIRIVITGTEKDLDYANKLINMTKDVKPINACAKTTINQLACLIRRCSVYVSPDSAPLHVACAVGTPFIALFGPTDPRRHLAPAKDYIVIKKDLPCTSCYKSKCKTKECMELISPQEVLEAINKLIV